MATVAGDEITEALMQAYLVDFDTAEELKAKLAAGGSLEFTDVLGLPQTQTAEDVAAVVAPAADRLAEEIANEILSVNGSAPSAVFLAGGGSKLPGLRERVAAALGMDPKRVAVAGNHFQNTVYSDTLELNDPAYTTPLGIAASAGLGLISDSCQVLLNGSPAKLFRSGSLTAMELLMMNGYTYTDLLGRSGKPLTVKIDGQPRVFHGDPSLPAQLQINGKDAGPTAVVHAGDHVDFTPATPGADRRMTAGELIKLLHTPSITVNGTVPGPEDLIPPGAVIVKTGRPVKPAPAEAPAPVRAAAWTGTLNGKPFSLPGKADGAPYYMMDLLEPSGMDFEHVERPVTLRLNGQPCGFQQVLKNGDLAEIVCEDEMGKT